MTSQRSFHQPSQAPVRAAALLAAFALTGSIASAQFSLTLLHNNDGESKLLPLTGVDAGFGGAAYFAGLVSQEKAAATTAGREYLMLSSGDNFLAGTTFAASVANGTFYDATVISEIGYDAVILGNHDFDFGPQTLADFISQTSPSTMYLSANLDFTPEASLAALVTSGKIAKSTIVTKGGEQIGIVGATTPQISTISSPGNIIINDVATAVQAEINALKLAGVNKIVVVSHLQSLSEDLALIPLLTDVDVAISGGGDDFLSNSAAPHAPGTVIPSNTNTNPVGTYPVATAMRAGDNKIVPVITTTGEYRYLGKLEINFDAAGDVVSYSAGNLPGGSPAVGPLPVQHSTAVTPNANIQNNVIPAVQSFVNGLAANVLASGSPALDGRRSEVRSKETNEGNLLADAVLYQATQRAAAFGLDTPSISFVNGGGMRKDAILPAGNVTELNTFEISPFGNFVAVMEDVTLVQLKSILENAYSQTSLVGGVPTATGGATGRFAQISGFSVIYDITAPGSVLDPSGAVISDGSRIMDVILDTGLVLFEDGMANPALPGDFTIDVATLDFLARGGDGYPTSGITFGSVGLTDQQALAGFISEPGGLNGVISSADYGAPEGRITAVPEPTTSALLAGAAVLLGFRRRRTAARA